MLLVTSTTETVVDLLVEDRNVTLQYGQIGAPSAQDAQIYCRQKWFNINKCTYLLWDEGADKWKVHSNDGSYRIMSYQTTTTDLIEGTNLYYTDARSRAAVSVTTATPSGDGSLSYDNGTGVFTGLLQQMQV